MMNIFRNKIDDSGICVFELKHDSGASARITNYGAIIMSLVMRNRKGELRDYVLGFDTVNAYNGSVYRSAYPYFGALIGRYANRIQNGRFSLNGKTYQLPVNLGNDTLHGGLQGFDSKIWTVVDYQSLPEPQLTLSYTSPHLEEGFPGNLTVTITYTLEADALRWQLEAETDAPTIFNPAQHSYFNLNGGTGSIENHNVKLYSSQYMEQDESLCVTGKLLSAGNTALDFATVRPVNRGWNAAQGYDQTFIIDDYDGTLRLCAEAWPEDESVCMQVFTTEPVVHFYTGRWIPEVKGKNGVDYGPYSGFCFETQHHPNAINLEGFPKTILLPGEKFTRTERYRFI